MKSKIHNGPEAPKGVERGSAHFHTMGNLKFWFNTTNRIFIRVETDGRIIWPRLQGGQVHYDDPHFTPPEDAGAWLLETLKKQQAIRSEHFVEEEADAFTYHTVV